MSFRWYGLAVLLFIQAVHDVWMLLKSKGQELEYKAKTVVFKTLAAILLTFVSVIPALIFPAYESLATTGPYLATTPLTTYTDNSRLESFTNSGEKRRINVGFWYPQTVEGDETYPIVVFSHGGLGLQSSNESLYRELASHGYIVCAIGHPYHAFWTKGEDGRITFVNMDYFRELQREDAKSDMQQSYHFYRQWMAVRTRDINFVIDTILEKTAPGADGVYSLVDVERIGVMGHSLGGSAALAMPRLRDDIAVVIALESPFLFDIVGAENDAFVFINEPYPVPNLNIYSDSSWPHLAEWPQYARNYALLSDPSATAHSLHLSGRGHFSLTDLSLASPLLVRLLEGQDAAKEGAQYLQEVNEACLAFFDLYLKHQ